MCLDEIHALWLWLSVVEFLLKMSWQFSVPSVVDVLRWEESIWDVVLVELLVGQLNVVLNTITIGVVDFIGASSPHEEVVVSKGLGGVNNIDELIQEVLGGSLLKLKVCLVKEGVGSLILVIDGERDFVS